MVGDVIERLYPGGVEWLDRKLHTQARDPTSVRCTLAEAGSTLLGLTIETVKGMGLTKLSTIWVNDSVRGRGIGTKLIDACVANWMRERRSETYVTVSLQLVEVVARLLVPAGFFLRAVEPNRYGRGRDEVILTWTPESAARSADRGWIDDQLQSIHALDQQHQQT